MIYYSRAFQLGLLERPSVNTKLGSGKIAGMLRSTAETRAIENGQQQLCSYNWTEHDIGLFSISLLHLGLLKWQLFCYYAIIINNKVGNVRKTLQYDVFTWCSYLMGYPNSLIPFHSKGAFLWRFNIADNNKTYLHIRSNVNKFRVSQKVH
jgi:hypothetical protein